MKIQDFCDMNKFEQIMKNWANSTGLATVAVGADGKYISDCYNFTEFCIDLTRGSAEGKKRCEQCDREGPWCVSLPCGTCGFRHSDHTGGWNRAGQYYRRTGAAGESG